MRDVLHPPHTDVVPVGGSLQDRRDWGTLHILLGDHADAALVRDHTHRVLYVTVCWRVRSVYPDKPSYALYAAVEYSGLHGSGIRRRPDLPEHRSRHTVGCVDRYLAARSAFLATVREADTWRARWPGHCANCHGRGGFEYGGISEPREWDACRFCLGRERQVVVRGELRWYSWTRPGDDGQRERVPVMLPCAHCPRCGRRVREFDEDWPERGCRFCGWGARDGCVDLPQAPEPLERFGPDLQCTCYRDTPGGDLWKAAKPGA